MTSIHSLVAALVGETDKESKCKKEVFRFSEAASISILMPVLKC